MAAFSSCVVFYDTAQRSEETPFEADVGTDASDAREADVADSGGGDVSVDDTGRSEDGGCEVNSCGGCGELADEPGTPCGACGDGSWTCDGTDRVVCTDASLENPCGGCRPLGAVPGTACGPCGLDLYICDGIDSIVCEGDTPFNECGGCEALPEPLDAPCGPCGGDFIQCDGAGSSECSGETPGNFCGGCDLGLSSGDACLMADCGELGVSVGEAGCAGTDVECVCPVEGCGNGILEGSEECDDGNTARFDGCDQSCSHETNLSTHTHCPGGPDDGPFLFVGQGLVRFDSCDGEFHEDQRFEPGGECVGGMSDHSQMVSVFEVGEPSRVIINAVDADGVESIDTRVFIRENSCEAGAQLACSDGVPCASSSVGGACHSSEQRREAEIDIEIAAGTYFLIIESVERVLGGTEYVCGAIEVSFNITPLSLP